MPILNRDQEVELDIEGFEINGISKSQVRDIKSILRENKEVFMVPVRPSEVEEHRIGLKPGVEKKK